jgi:Flp pilus assembly protein TadG
MIKHFLKNQKGTTIVLFALTLPVMLGFCGLATDIGIMCLEKTRITKLVDAAAIAGIYELPGTPANARASAQATAFQYANLNGLKGSDTITAVPTDNYTMPVSITRKVPFSFVKIFGINEGTVSATVVARLTQASVVYGVIPWGASTDVLQMLGKQVQFQFYQSGGGGNNINGGFLNLTKINPNDTYLSMIKNGYGGTLTKGQTVSKYITATTALADDTVNGIATRIANGQRLVALPIVDSMGDNSPTGKILGFAIFQLENVYKQSESNVYVTGTFVQAVANGQGGGTGTNYGAWAYQLSPK